MWRRLGLSVDWTLTYTTVGTQARRTSQRAFLRNLARGEAYRADAPTLWDVDYRTAVAQAELEDRERPGAYHALRFRKLNGGGDLMIDTTRPELLAACVAVVAHPDDERFRPLFGTEVETPLYGARVPVVAHRLADPEKGTGVAMICTFGDTTDVVWWRELQLPMRTIVGVDGRILADAPEGLSEAGARAYADIAGKTVKQAQKVVVEQLQAAGELDGEPRPITHPVKFYERGDRPLEIVASRQWYYRNGGRDPELRERAPATRPRAAVAPAAHAQSLRDVDRGPQLRLADQPPALLRCAVPGVVSRRCERRGRARRPDPRERGRRCPSTRPPTCRPATPRISAGSRAASSPTPT